jgi:hypothetical protein
LKTVSVRTTACAPVMAMLLAACGGGAQNPLPAAIVVVEAAALPAAPPRILRQPQPLTVTEGGAAMFVAAANGTGPLRWQWLRDGVPIAGAHGSVLRIDAALRADHGARYVAVVTSDSGSAMTEPARLWVDPVGTREAWD